MKNTFVALILFVLVFETSMVFAAGAKDRTSAQETRLANLNKTGLPIVKEKVTLNMAAMKTLHTKPFGEMESVAYFEEQTNVRIEWQEIPRTGWNEKVNLMLASGDLPDAFFSYLSDDIVLKYGPQGVLIALEDLIAEWGINLPRIFGARPDIKKLATAPDGHIYSLAAGSEAPWLTSSDNFYVHQPWLDKLGLSRPTTTEEFYQVLKDFKSKDPNGNGKQDEIPFSFAQQGGTARALDSMFGAFGVLDNIRHITIENGSISFSPAQPQYLDAVKYFNKLYKEGLIDTECFTHKTGQYIAKLKAPDVLVGVFMAFIQDNHVGAGRANDYPHLLPLEGPSGDQLWNQTGVRPLMNRNKFSITSENTMPEVTMRWVDNIMDGDVNTLIMGTGPENVTWRWLPDGNWETYSDNVPEGSSWGVLRHTVAPASTGAFLQLMSLTNKRKLDERTQKKLDRCIAYEPFFGETLPNAYPIPEIQEELNILAADIHTYVENVKATWIMEGVSDAQWREHLGKLKALKVDRYVELYQELYDKTR